MQQEPTSDVDVSNGRTISDVLHDPDTEWKDIRAAMKRSGRPGSVNMATTNAAILQALRRSTAKGEVADERGNTAGAPSAYLHESETGDDASESGDEDEDKVASPPGEIRAGDSLEGSNGGESTNESQSNLPVSAARRVINRRLLLRKGNSAKGLSSRSFRGAVGASSRSLKGVKEDEEQEEVEDQQQRRRRPRARRLQRPSLERSAQELSAQSINSTTLFQSDTTGASSNPSAFSDSVNVMDFGVSNRLLRHEPSQRSLGLSSVSSTDNMSNFVDSSGFLAWGGHKRESTRSLGVGSTTSASDSISNLNDSDAFLAWDKEKAGSITDSEEKLKPDRKEKDEEMAQLRRDLESALNEIDQLKGAVERAATAKGYRDFQNIFDDLKRDAGASRKETEALKKRIVQLESDLKSKDGEIVQLKQMLKSSPLPGVEDSNLQGTRLKVAKGEVVVVEGGEKDGEVTETFDKSGRNNPGGVSNDEEEEAADKVWCIEDMENPRSEDGPPPVGGINIIKDDIMRRLNGELGLPFSYNPKKKDTVPSREPVKTVDIKSALLKESISRDEPDLCRKSSTLSTIYSTNSSSEQIRRKSSSLSSFMQSITWAVRRESSDTVLDDFPEDDYSSPAIRISKEDDVDIGQLRRELCMAGGGDSNETRAKRRQSHPCVRQIV